jgi:hypothetical protein
MPAQGMRALFIASVSFSGQSNMFVLFWFSFGFLAFFEFVSFESQAFLLLLWSNVSFSVTFFFIYHLKQGKLLCPRRMARVFIVNYHRRHR